MRRILLLASLAALAACTRDPLFPGRPRYTREPAGHKPVEAADSTLVPLSGVHVWATAVRFPEDFDWEVDTCAVEGDVWLDLYCDGRLLRSFPAGASLQADMHRFAGGHLYADCSTDTETVLYRDGAELFRFGGREALRGFRVLEDGVHTLGQDRDGDGLTYRIDGREVFRSPVGTVFGEGEALSESGGALWYCYSVQGASGRDFLIMREAELAGKTETKGVILDFRLSAGKSCWVQSQRGSLALMEDGGKRVPIVLNAGETVRSCRIAPGADDLYVAVQTDRNGIRRSFVQAARGSLFRLADGLTVAAILTDGKETGWVVTAADGAIRLVRENGDVLSVPSGGFLYGPRCAVFHEGHLHLALSGHFGEPGRLVTDTDVTQIPFNGYFTSITVE